MVTVGETRVEAVVDPFDQLIDVKALPEEEAVSVALSPYILLGLPHSFEAQLTNTLMVNKLSHPAAL